MSPDQMSLHKVVKGCMQLLGLLDLMNESFARPRGPKAYLEFMAL